MKSYGENVAYYVNNMLYVNVLPCLYRLVWANAEGTLLLIVH